MAPVIGRPHRPASGSQWEENGIGQRNGSHGRSSLRPGASPKILSDDLRAIAKIASDYFGREPAQNSTSDGDLHTNDAEPEGDTDRRRWNAHFERRGPGSRGVDDQTPHEASGKTDNAAEKSRPSDDRANVDR